MYFEKLRKQFLKDRVQRLYHIFNLEESSILDLGGYDGRYMDYIKESYPNAKVTIADRDVKGLEIAKGKGYNTILLDGEKRLPFPDSYFDLVFCNSVIEHVTIPKNEIWDLKSTKEFKQRSIEIQRHFASEIMRISKNYFVQTPNKNFIIEHHSWTPFLQFVPRKLQIEMMRFYNKFWIKKTSPDWNLLKCKEMKELFPDGKILKEKFLFMNKSIIAYRNVSGSIVV